MCCCAYIPGHESDRKLNIKCIDCDEPVDQDGDSLYYCCGYSPMVCKTCGWKPCDGSC